MDKDLKSRLFNQLVDSLPEVDITKLIDEVVKLKKDLEQYYTWGQKRFLFNQKLQSNPEFRDKMSKLYYLN